MKRLLFLMLLVASTSAIFAQKAKEADHKKEHANAGQAAYTCPMHPDVTSTEPGKCPKCGMELNLSPKEEMKTDLAKIYTCPMHPGVVMGKAGKCSKCGMDLKEMAATYTCPMHADVTSNEPGKCSKCGTALNLSLKEKMKMGAMKMYTCPMHADISSDEPGKCSKCGMDLTKNK